MSENRNQKVGSGRFGRIQGTIRETRSERWKRIYNEPGGPLMGWLRDEAAKRGMSFSQLATQLYVTVGYLSQLRTGIRKTANISHDFAAACGEFLAVPTVVVLVVAGHLKLVDFVCATDFDRWVENTVGQDDAQAVQLACGARVGEEELRLLPLMVKALYGAASIHEKRARAT